MYAKIERICEYCHKSFLGSKHSKYCGYDCSHTSRRRRVDLICQECGKHFERQSWNSDAKFCSYGCKTKSQSSDIVTTTCTNCGKLFDRKEYRLNRNKSGKRFCSKICADNYNSGKNHYEWKPELKDKHINLSLKRWSRRIKKRDNYTCQVCKENNLRKLEAHHIKPKSTFPELMFDLDNGVTLCLKCHSFQHIDDKKSFRLINYKINIGMKKKGCLKCGGKVKR